MTITWRVQSVGYWPRGNGACGRLDTYQSGNGILGSSDTAASDLPPMILYLTLQYAIHETTSSYLEIKLLSRSVKVIRHFRLLKLNFSTSRYYIFFKTLSAFCDLFRCILIWKRRASSHFYINNFIPKDQYKTQLTTNKNEAYCAQLACIN